MGLHQGLNPWVALGKGRVSIAGSFTTVNGSSPTVTTGSGFTVARTGEGVWTITLDESPRAIVSFNHSIAAKTAGVPSVLVEDIDGRTGTTVFTLENYLASALSTVTWAAADDPGSIISFEVIARNTSVDY